jgi:hypothetical protein
MTNAIPEAFVKMMNGAETIEDLKRVGGFIKKQIDIGSDYTKDQDVMTMLRSNYEINLKRIQNGTMR